MKLQMPKGDLTELRSLAPNCGYFGGSDWNSLVVVIDREIDWICLQNGTDEAEYLNLQQVVFISRGRDVSHEIDLASTCTKSSSVSGDGRPASDLLRGGGVHTDRETGASWELRFERPIHLDRVVIRNRSDLYGARSNSLHVLLGEKSKLWVAYDPFGAGQYGWLFGLLRSTPGPSSGNQDFRLKLLHRAKNVAVTVADASAGNIWRYLQLIDQNETDHLHKAANIELIAAVTARYHAAGYEIETRDLHQFSSLLAEKRDIIAYENAFNCVLREFSNQVVTVSRHFISASKLLTQKALYCTLIKEIHEIAKQCGNEVCLGYGTLLGCIRDRGFIPHDDDIDLIVRVPRQESESGSSNRDFLLRRLRENGYQVEQFVGYEHHNLKKSNVCVELFPAYENGEAVRLYMESMKFREIPKSCMFPLQAGRLYDIDVNIPANPQAFLEERYGSGWKRPDRFYEWRWKLSGDDPTAPEYPEFDEMLRGFDEARYLELHPDVARAVQAGHFKNGRSHFVKFGRSEDRPIK